jgi:hypothetical protein
MLRAEMLTTEPVVGKVVLATTDPETTTNLLLHLLERQKLVAALAMVPQGRRMEGPQLLARKVPPMETERASALSVASSFGPEEAHPMKHPSH